MLSDEESDPLALSSSFSESEAEASESLLSALLVFSFSFSVIFFASDSEFTSSSLISETL